MSETSEGLERISEFEPVEHKVKDAKRSKRRLKWLICTAVATGVLLVSYISLAVYHSDKMPARASVAGVDIGGMSVQEAKKVLVSELEPRLEQLVKVRIGAEERELKPEEFEARLDAEGTVSPLADFTLNPVKLWKRLTGGGEYGAVVKVNDDKLSAAVTALGEEIKSEPVNAALTFNGTTPVTTPAVSGKTLDKQAAVEKIKGSLLSSHPIDLPVHVKEAEITDEEAAKALSSLATPLVSANVSVNVNTKLVTLTPEHLAEAARFESNGGKISLVLDQKLVGDKVREQASDILVEGSDARIEIVDHTTPKVIPSQDGVGIDEADLAAKVTAAATSSDRTVDVATVAMPAKFTTADAEAMGIKEVVSSIKTPLTNDSVRTHNLVTGTKKITNTLVKPGETFSLLQALGPITAANGFTSSGVVANGFNSTAMGGGLSQLSTNTFNVGYLAGFEDVEHKPHSKYFSRYPMGREATLWEGQIDMKWKNTTPYGAVIDTWVANGEVHTYLWSTKHYDVDVATSAPYNKVAPTTKRNPASDCEPSGAGGPGFTVTVSRKVSLQGAVVEDKSYAWTYSPVDAVVCE